MQFHSSVVMMKSLVVLSILLFSACLTESSRVRKCGTEDKPDENNEIFLDACERLPCKLIKGRKVNIELKITPDRDMPKVLNSVHAKILGVPFPFIGVDGNDVCDKMYDASGAKAGCPLKAGQQYVYKDSFPVLSAYPNIRVWVHWALVDGKGTALCFEVPVKISS